MAVLKLSTPLRNSVGGESQLEVDAQTVAELVTQVESQYPGFKQRVCDAGGQIAPHINVFVNKEHINFLDGVDTALNDDDTVTFLPSMAGG